MKKAISFKGGVRGKYAGKKITIIGATDVTDNFGQVQPPKELPLIVNIDDDIAAVFKTPEAINQALRGLIKIMTAVNR